MLIRLATEPALPDRPNEDFIAATPEVLILLDGAGSPPGLETGCTHSVAWYVRHLGPALLAEAHRNQSLVEALTKAISQVADLHHDRCDLSDSGGPSSTVIAVRQREVAIEYLVLGDSTLLIWSQDELQVITDDREAKAGRTLRSEMDETANGTPAHEAALEGYIRAMRLSRNIDGGFWVASSEPTAAAESLTGTVSRREISLLALLSDGATRMVDRFGLLTWRDLAQVLSHDDGPERLIAQTREVENSDLMGRQWPRGKAIDDASVILVKNLPQATNQHVKVADRDRIGSTSA